MRGHEFSSLLISVVSLSCLLSAPNPALAYVGPGPSMELIPFFYSMLVWVALALGSVLLWPLNALILRFRNRRG